MTTPPTPADWYPDPENPGGLRYWDGSIWTEHRAPAPTQQPAQEPTSAEPAPPAQEFGGSEQSTSVVNLPPQSGADDSGAHSAPAGTPPSLAKSTNEPGAHEAGAYGAEPQGAGSAEAGSYGAGSYGAGSYGAQQPYGAPPPTRPFDAQGGQFDPQGGPATSPYGAPPYGPPPGGPGGPTDPTGGGSNKKLLIGLAAGAAALILIVALVLVYVFVVDDDDTANTASQSSSSSKSRSSQSSSSASSESESTETETTVPEAPVGGEEGVDGDFVFQVIDVEPTPTVTSTFSDQVVATAGGMYAVVRVMVGNVGTEPVTFLATFQRLVASGQVLSPDDIATAYAGGTFTEIPPGSKVETVVVFDVPDGAEPESFEFHGSPIGPGVVLPFPT